MEVNDTQQNTTMLPTAEQFAQSQEEYIRTLEMAYQVLQREVEHLRQQRKPVEVVKEAINSEGLPEDISALLLALTGPDDVIATLSVHCRERYGLSLVNVFFFEHGGITPLSTMPGEEHLIMAVRNFDEQGILDWVIGQQELRIVPNLHGNDSQESAIMVIPLMLRGAPAGVFAGFTHRNDDDCDAAERQRLMALAETAAITLDNIRSAAEIVRMNKRLNILNRQMLQSSKLASIGELAGTVAHEINNPLQILLAHLQLLESGVGDPDRRMEVIKNQVFRISEITRRLLDFARSSPTEFIAVPTDICAVIDGVISFVGAQLNRDAVHIVKEYEEQSMNIVGSKTHLEQVFLNLLLNARDAMPDGGTITIGVFKHEKRKVIITVADTGTGISDENLEHIFEPFFSTKQRGKGTGLGLSISKSIIQQHKGSIEVVSGQAIRGTTFKITLPFASDAHNPLAGL
ncbi:MAG: GHKL domain-containing protein [Candidatus Kapabacteria bacterium]|jgi:signal transduction histidine kinase|nr:GHKL domain-containing protein [Candidatus Kapabacteria bacterium]